MLPVFITFFYLISGGEMLEAIIGFMIFTIVSILLFGFDNVIRYIEFSDELIFGFLLKTKVINKKDVNKVYEDKNRIIISYSNKPERIIILRNAVTDELYYELKTYFVEYLHPLDENSSKKEVSE